MIQVWTLENRRLCPMTAGIFISIAAWASEQRSEDKTPYW